MAEAFAGLVARLGPDLHRVAVLLGGDDGAGELVRTALAAVRTRRTADPAARARTVLVRRALTRTGPTGSGWVEDAWDPDDDLRRALATLPGPTRAAVVLSVAERLPDDAIAAVLRLPRDAVRSEVDAGAAALRAAGPDADLPDALERLARAARDAPCAAELVRAVGRRRRRRVLAAAAAAVVAASSALLLPSGSGTQERTGRSAPVDLGELAPRGTLAADRSFLAGLARQPWTGEVLRSGGPAPMAPEPGTARVLFAGDVPGGRWALLAARRQQVQRPGASAEDPLVAWFTGPVGAAPEDMTLVTLPSPLVPGRSPALVDPPSGTLVVVGTPGDVVEVSARDEVDAAGGSARNWTTARTTDGVSLARFEPLELPWTWSVAYRVVRDGRVLPPTSPDGRRTGPAAGRPPVTVAYPRGTPSGEARRAAEEAAFAAAASAGLPPEDATITARLAAPAPSPADGALALVTATLPSGALMVSGQWTGALPDGRPGGADCGLDVRPAGPPPEERVLAAGCRLFAPAADRRLDSVLLVAAPPSVAEVRVYGGGGAFLGAFEPVDGQLVVPMPVGTREVEAVTGAGVLLGRTPLLGHWTPSPG